jgi:hypothetical protein
LDHGPTAADARLVLSPKALDFAATFPAVALALKILDREVMPLPKSDRHARIAWGRFVFLLDGFLYRLGLA